MYKALYALCLLAVASCNSSDTKEQIPAHDTAIVSQDTIIPDDDPQFHNKYAQVIPSYEIGDSSLITGDFDGDNIPDSGYLVVVDKHIEEFDPKDYEDGEENHMDSVIYHYDFRFGDRRLATLPDLSGAAVALVNEGDLNHDGTDEISVLQQYLVVGMCAFNTYTYRTGKWEQIFSSEFSGYSAPIDKIEIDGRILMKDSIPYYYETDEAEGRKLEFVSK